MQTLKPRLPSIPDNLESTAADWLARRDRGLSADEQVQFQRWLAADSLHAAAWRELESAWLEFDRPRRAGLAGAMMRELALRCARRRWKTVGWVTTALAAGIAVAFVLQVKPAPAQTSVLPSLAKTEVSEPEHRVLPDGSVIELNTSARVEVDYQPAARYVHLLRGVAHFIVAKNAARPFIVIAGNVEVKAVGTAFAVRLKSQAVDVLVTEGKVAVDRSTGNQTAGGGHASVTAPVFVSAGNRLLVPAISTPGETLQAKTLPEAEIEHWMAWRYRHFELTGTPLSEAVELLNRENRIQLSVADAELARMRMSGVFRMNNTEGFVRLLESNYGVRVEHRGENEIILHKTRETHVSD